MVLLGLAILISSVVAPQRVDAAVQPAFLYRLANFSGPLPFNWAKIHYVEGGKEIIAIDTRNSDVRLFDENGMEVYRFGDDGRFGTISDAVVNRSGEIFVLSKSSRRTALIRCNFRGDPVSELVFRNFPADFSGFAPDRLVSHSDSLYLLEEATLRIARTDRTGRFERGYDIAELIQIEEEKRAETGVGGFSVDGEGNILCTIPVFFSAYKLTPHGKIAGFGRPGSSPGRFGIVGGIVADDRGYLYVAAQLRCVVLVFDRNFEFQSEFGYRGPRPDNFIAPKYLILDNENRLYVSQLRKRGVSVFKLTYN